MTRDKWINLGFQFAAVALAILFTTVILLLAGAPPIDAYGNIVSGSIGSMVDI